MANKAHLAIFRKSPVFYTAKGRLSAYAFACGYREFDGPFRLYREHNVYHVQGKSVDGSFVWNTYETLAEARRELRVIGHMYGRFPIERGVYVNGQ